MQTAKESDDRGQLLVDLLIIQALNTLSQLTVRVISHENWCLRIHIHEVLEASIATLLKLYVVGEAMLDHRVDLLFEIQQLLGENDRIRQQRLVLNESGAKRLDILLKAVYNRTEIWVFPREALIEEY